MITLLLITLLAVPDTPGTSETIVAYWVLEASVGLTPDQEEHYHQLTMDHPVLHDRTIQMIYRQLQSMIVDCKIIINDLKLWAYDGSAVILDDTQLSNTRLLLLAHLCLDSRHMRLIKYRYPGGKNSRPKNRRKHR